MSQVHVARRVGALVVSLTVAAGALAMGNPEAPRATTGLGSRNEPPSAGTQDPERDKNWRADEDQEAEERRRSLDDMADQTLERLTREHPGAADLLNDAYGYAVFGGIKAGVLVTGTGGSGVAIDRRSDARTYMHMGAAGIGALGGAQEFNLVVLFENREVFEEFVNGTWEAGLSAQAAAGEESANAVQAYHHGVAVYQFTDAGLMAQAEITGARFWPDDDLNEAG